MYDGIRGIGGDNLIDRWDWQEELRQRHIAPIRGTQTTTTPTNAPAPICGRNIDSTVVAGTQNGVPIGPNTVTALNLAQNPNYNAAPTFQTAPHNQANNGVFDYLGAGSGAYDVYTNFIIAAPSGNLGIDPPWLDVLRFYKVPNGTSFDPHVNPAAAIMDVNARSDGNYQLVRIPGNVAGQAYDIYMAFIDHSGSPSAAVLIGTTSANPIVIQPGNGAPVPSGFAWSAAASGISYSKGGGATYDTTFNLNLTINNYGTGTPALSTWLYQVAVLASIQGQNNFSQVNVVPPPGGTVINGVVAPGLGAGNAYDIKIRLISFNSNSYTDSAVVFTTQAQFIGPGGALSGSGPNLVVDSNFDHVTGGNVSNNTGSNDPYWNFYWIDGSSFYIGAGGSSNSGGIANYLGIRPADSSRNCLAQSCAMTVAAGQQYAASGYIDASRCSGANQAEIQIVSTDGLTVYARQAQTNGQSGTVSVPWTCPNTGGPSQVTFRFASNAVTINSGILVFAAPQFQMGQAGPYQAGPSVPSATPTTPPSGDGGSGGGTSSGGGPADPNMPVGHYHHGVHSPQVRGTIDDAAGGDGSYFATGQITGRHFVGGNANDTGAMVDSSSNLLYTRHHVAVRTALSSSAGADGSYLNSSQIYDRHVGSVKLDTINDGTTYARPLASRISSGKPLIDFSENIHLNKTLDYIPNGVGSFAVSSIDSNRRALIDLSQSGHINTLLQSKHDPTVLLGSVTGNQRNLVPDSDFKFQKTYWSAVNTAVWGSGPNTWSIGTIEFYGHVPCITYIGNGSAAGFPIVAGSVMPVKANTTYVLSCGYDFDNCSGNPPAFYIFDSTNGTPNWAFPLATFNAAAGTHGRLINQTFTTGASTTSIQFAVGPGNATVLNNFGITWYSPQIEEGALSTAYKPNTIDDATGYLFRGAHHPDVTDTIVSGGGIDFSYAKHINRVPYGHGPSALESVIDSNSNILNVEFSGAKIQSDGSLTNADYAVSKYSVPCGTGGINNVVTIEATIAAGPGPAEGVGGVGFDLVDPSNTNHFYRFRWSSDNSLGIFATTNNGGAWTTLQVITLPTYDSNPHHYKFCVTWGTPNNTLEASFNDQHLGPVTDASFVPSSVEVRLLTGGDAGTVRNLHFSVGSGLYSQMHVGVRSTIAQAAGSDGLYQISNTLARRHIANNLGHNILYGTAFYNSVYPWIPVGTPGGSYSFGPDTYAGGRCVLSRTSTTGTSDYVAYQTFTSAGGNVTVSGLVETDGNGSGWSLVGGGAWVDLFDTNTSTILASSPAVTVNGSGQIPFSITGATIYNHTYQVRLRTQIATGNAFFYKIKAEYGSVATPWDDAIALSNVSYTFANDGSVWRSTAWNNQGSMPPCATPGVSMSATNSSGNCTVTITWSAGTIYTPDNSTITVSAGSWSQSNLSAAVTYHYSVYADSSGGVHVIGNYGSNTAPNGQQKYQIYLDGRYPITEDCYVTTPSTSGGGYSGGGGGGGGSCPSLDQIVHVKELGYVAAREYRVGMHLMGPDGQWKRILKITYETAQLFRVTVAGETYEVDTNHYWLGANGEFIKTPNLCMNAVLRAADGRVLPVDGIVKGKIGQYAKTQVEGGQFVIGLLIGHNAITL